MRNLNEGFTLIECVVCLLVISILLAIGIPGFSSTQGRVRFRTELNTLVSSLHQSKMAAIKSNSYVVIQIHDNNYNIFLDDGSGGGIMGDWLRQDKETVLTNYDLPDGFDLTSNLSLGRTRFRGQPGMKAGTLILKGNNGSEARIVISTIGRIRTIIR